MSNNENKFKDYYIETDFMTAEFVDYNGDEKENLLLITFRDGFDTEFKMFLNKGTAIKFTKKLLNEIDKILESEVNNG